ncbi:MAG: bifunctional precorrin-2 dehydrogenase/sirohydrochlorin ferrochelatase [candidate division Zixibacteria bacterium]|nr:bifunctional precorrin-2 dehydrogenase/sirohydrochlorin ferrochelatase [Candidatus Tariuqbacter arcticus]
MKFFPLFFRTAGKKILVIGGGKVAERKVQQLLEFGAEITIVAPETTQKLKASANIAKIKWEKRGYQKGEANGYSLVIATTNEPEVNRQIHQDAVVNGVLLNVVDQPELCTVIFPAMIRRGDMTIAISSDGKAPFLTREVKEGLDRTISRSLGRIVEMAVIYREWVRKNCEDEAVKRKLYDKFLYFIGESLNKWSTEKPPIELWDKWLKEIK